MINGEDFMPKFPDWLNTAFAVVLIGSLLLGFYRFAQLQTSTLSDLTSFFPTGLVAILWIAIPAIFHLFAVVPQYDLATWLGVVCIVISFIIIYESIQTLDASKQSILSAFGGSLLGFGTGMPIGRRLQPIKTSSGNE